MKELVQKETYKLKKIIPCSRCNSTGIVEHEELTCYHKRDYSYWNELCTHCEGEGRVVETTVTTRIEIYHNEESQKRLHEIKDTFIESLKGKTTGDIYKIRGV